MTEPSPEIEDRIFSREEYRAWCAAQPRGRFEREDGHIVAMAAERAVHARVKGAVYIALRRAITAAGLHCEAFPDGMTVETGENDYEPDALVNCGPFLDPHAVAVPDPVVIVEVLSPTTRTTDTSSKLDGYFQLPSVAHYLIVRPIQRRVIHHRRAGDRIDTAILANGPIALDPPGIAITVEELFDGLDAAAP